MEMMNLFFAKSHCNIHDLQIIGQYGYKGCTINSYCIPYKRVCDGINDCQDGQDEGFCKNFVCRGMFKCKNQTFCISQVSVCDDVADCPFGDDEQNCEKFLCLRGCDCTPLTESTE